MYLTLLCLTACWTVQFCSNTLKWHCCHCHMFAPSTVMLHVQFVMHKLQNRTVMQFPSLFIQAGITFLVQGCCVWQLMCCVVSTCP